ncbi:hypothetical protein D9611_000791 [Ephemerocybe angulata]|uniref:G domain-containing protein n=1 Tax=Ephemerocybe angulata TaxID=980116 RepID=A0A8H5BNL8_9AGAR|nr:hypothetical protein D9611_000791 [Tulosesus angulatus]
MINIDLAEGGGARAMRLEDDDEGSTLNIVNMILERVDKWAGQTLEDEAPWPIQKSSARKHLKTDIVILLTGETGAGKSSFINALLGQAGDQKRFRVGEALVSCTTRVESAFIEGQTGNYRHIRGQRVVVVDTPGFDDTFAADLQILKRITLWLDESHKRNMVLEPDHTYQVVQRCWAGLEKVVMVTTKWDREDGAVNKFAAKEEELKGIYQKSGLSVEKGDDVTVERWNPCSGTRAWEIVHTLLKRFDGELGLESRDSDSGQVSPENDSSAFPGTEHAFRGVTGPHTTGAKTACVSSYISQRPTNVYYHLPCEPSPVNRVQGIDFSQYPAPSCHVGPDWGPYQHQHAQAQAPTGASNRERDLWTMIDQAQLAKSRVEQAIQHKTTQLVAIERSLACIPIAGNVPSLLSPTAALHAPTSAPINPTLRSSTNAIADSAVSTLVSKPPAYSWQGPQVAFKSKGESPKNDVKEVSTKQPFRKSSPEGSLIGLLRPHRHSKEGRSENSSRVCTDRTHNNKPNQSPPPSYQRTDSTFPTTHKMNIFANANRAVPTISGSGSSERPAFPTNIQTSSTTSNLVAAVPGVANRGRTTFPEPSAASYGASDAMEQLRAINQTFHYHQSRFALPAKLDFITQTSNQLKNPTVIFAHLSVSFNNHPVRCYEQTLISLLEQLQPLALHAEGCKAFRMRRKAAVAQIERALEDLEEKVTQRWKADFSKA